MSLPSLGSFRRCSAIFVAKQCIYAQESYLSARSFGKYSIRTISHASASTSRSLSIPDNSDATKSDPLVRGQKGLTIRKTPQRGPSEDRVDGFSSSDRYRRSGYIRPDQVLYIKALNGNLIPEDFVRTIGTGAPSYIRVIPMRNRKTYKRDGNYLVVFESAEDAQAWRKHVERLNNLTNKHTMTSILHPDVVPGPGFLINKVPVYEVTKKFTLLPAGSLLRSNWSQKLSVFKDELVQRGGYTLICKKNGFIVPKVLVRVFGVKLTLNDLLQAFLSDSIRRNMVWEIVLKQPNGKSNIMEIFSVDELEDNRQEDERAAFGDGPFGDGQGWVVEFKSWKAAHQFARAWHGLSFPFPSQNGYKWQLSYDAEVVMNSGAETKVQTEVLW